MPNARFRRFNRGDREFNRFDEAESFAPTTFTPQTFNETVVPQLEGLRPDLASLFLFNTPQQQTPSLLSQSGLPVGAGQVGTSAAPLAPGTPGVSGASPPFQGSLSAAFLPFLQEVFNAGGAAGISPTAAANSLIATILGQLAGGFN